MTDRLLTSDEWTPVEKVYWCQCLFCNGTGKSPHDTGLLGDRCEMCGGCGKIYAIEPFRGAKQ